MKKFFKYILIVTLPVLLFVATINYTIDPAHIFHPEYIDEIIEGLQRGKNVTNVTNIDERLFRKAFIELHRGETFDYLVIGSSRIMTISEDAFPGKRLLNIGVSGCKLEDIAALYQICKDNDIRFKNVIIGTDPVLLNANDNDTRWESIAYFYNRFKGTNQDVFRCESKIDNILSPSYFQSCLPEFCKIFQSKNKVMYTDTYINDGATERVDGSIYYDKTYRERTVDMVDADAKNKLHGSYQSFNSVSQERANLFNKIVKTFHSQNINVIFFFCPLHPIFYEKCINMPGFAQSMEYIKDCAVKNSITCIGDLNPKILGVNNTDFYDGIHCKKEIVDSVLLQTHK